MVHGRALLVLVNSAVVIVAGAAYGAALETSPTGGVPSWVREGLRPVWQETVLAWDDGEPDSEVTGQAGMKIAAAFQAPSWAQYVVGMEVYIADDGQTNPEDPGAPTTRPFMTMVWRPDALMRPGYEAMDGFVPFDTYECPEDTLVRITFPSAVAITDTVHFPDGWFFVGLEWLYRLNPVIGVDTDAPIDSLTYRWNWSQWERLDGDVIIRAVVGKDTTPPPPPPETIYVDLGGGGDYLTIQEGIDAAEAGDTVLVAPGVYTGPLNRSLACPGKWIHLVSEAGAESTAIDCEHQDRAFYLISGEGMNVHGFTVVNGSGSGGVMRLINSWLDAYDCVFRDNDGGDYGGAVYLNGAISGSARFERCVFDHNDAAVSGGAARLDFGWAWFYRCTFAWNEAPTGSTIDCNTASFIEVRNSIVTTNAGGTVISCSPSSSPFVTRSCVFANESGDSLCGDHSENMFLDPLFCPGELTLCDDSPCLPEGNVWGELVGAYGGGGCGPASGVPSGPGGWRLALHPARPNPFTSATRLSFELPAPVSVDATIFDVAGRLVRTVMARSFYAAGRHDIEWDGRNDAGRTVASGVYFCVVQAGHQTMTERVVLLR